MTTHFDLDDMVPPNTLHYALTIYRVVNTMVGDFLDRLDYPSTTILKHLWHKIIWECHCYLP